MKLYQCNKTVLRFYPDGAHFVNGYSTNVPEAQRNAFVDIHGKIIAIADQRKISNNEVWIVVESPFVDRLLTHLKKYLSISETEVQKLDQQKVYWDLETHRIYITDKPVTATVTEKEFTLYRVQKALPLQGVDYDQELVLNLADEALVSYSKGCYLGQEIVARVHYRGQPPKKLTVKSEKECSVEELARMTSKVFDPARGQTAGFVFVNNLL